MTRQVAACKEEAGGREAGERLEWPRPRARGSEAQPPGSGPPAGRAEAGSGSTRAAGWALAQAAPTGPGRLHQPPWSRASRSSRGRRCDRGPSVKGGRGGRGTAAR